MRSTFWALPARISLSVWGLTQSNYSVRKEWDLMCLRKVVLLTETANRLCLHIKVQAIENFGHLFLDQYYEKESCDN